MSFTDKVVLVTGACSGIGASTALLFAKEGAYVALAGQNQPKLYNVVEECKQYGKRYLPIIGDLRERDIAVNIIRMVVENFGKLDVLVNNAGVLRFAGILSPNLMDTYDETMDINLRAHVQLTNIAAPHLIRTKGNIVNVSSIASATVKGSVNMLSYFVSKAALCHFTRAIALELAEHGVRANSVSPGPARTNLLENANTSIKMDSFAENTALNRILEADEVGEVILFLASDKAKATTGSDYSCDNGFSIKG